MLFPLMGDEKWTRGEPQKVQSMFKEMRIYKAYLIYGFSIGASILLYVL